MNRLLQAVLILATLVASWLGLQAFHEAGHVVAAWVTGGSVRQVVLHPLAFSRTDLAYNPRPLFVVWAGPIVGVLLPLALWGVLLALAPKVAFLFRFIAGFCLIANGLYIGVGSFSRVGDAGDMLHLGTPIVVLWLFGVVMVLPGLALWHSQGPHFGLMPRAPDTPDTPKAPAIRPFDAGLALALALTFLVLSIAFAGRP